MGPCGLTVYKLALRGYKKMREESAIGRKKTMQTKNKVINCRKNFRKETV